jgi:hydrogenase expression/formation protein HypC
MCFALTGKVLGVEGVEALVDFDGVQKKANAEFIRVKKGDSVLVFNGFVIERL